MGCNIKQNVIEDLQERNLIKRTREIIDPYEFNFINGKYSDLAKEKYGMTRNDRMFTVEHLERTKLRTRTILRAVPNEDFFNEMEAADNPVEEAISPSQNNLVSLPKPVLNIKYLSAKELVNLDDPVNAKKIQDEIRKEYKDLEDLINCIWKN